MWVTLLSQRPSFPSFHREEEKVGLVAPLSVCSMLVAAFVATTPAATFHGSTLGVVWGKMANSVPRFRAFVVLFFFFLVTYF